MSSTRVAINRVVITGRAVTEPITKNVKSHHGDTTLTVFSIRTAKDTYGFVNLFWPQLGILDSRGRRFAR